MRGKVRRGYYLLNPSPEGGKKKGANHRLTGSFTPGARGIFVHVLEGTVPIGGRVDDARKVGRKRKTVAARSTVLWGKSGPFQGS